MESGERDAPDCPVCRSLRTCFLMQGRDRLFRVAPGTYRLYRCLHCRSIFQHPFPQPQSIREFYPIDYWWEDTVRQASGLAGWLKRFERAYREFVALDHVRFLQRCAGRFGDGKRWLLDVGCGSGLFLYLARRRGFKVHGMDMSARAVQIAREQYNIDVRQGAIGDNVWEGIRFDVITMFHVLEHLTDPGGALIYARRLLKPGGSLIVQVPNTDSLQARVFGGRWYGLDVPRHIINYAAAGLYLLVGNAGFRVQDTARFSMRDNPASIASSLAPWLDPVGRGARNLRQGVFTKALTDCIYFGLVVMCFPFALFESALGLGGTVWLHALSAEGS